METCCVVDVTGTRWNDVRLKRLKRLLSSFCTIYHSPLFFCRFISFRTVLSLERCLQRTSCCCWGMAVLDKRSDLQVLEKIVCKLSVCTSVRPSVRPFNLQETCQCSVYILRSFLISLHKASWLKLEGTAPVHAVKAYEGVEVYRHSFLVLS
jgi:hypothetical protein